LFAATAERLDLPDGSVDAVVGTLVLSSLIRKRSLVRV